MNKNDFIDLYAELGLSLNASESEIKRAYMDRIKEVHPDKLQNATENDRKQAEKKSQILNQAKEILLDAEKRFDYDNLYRSKLSEAATQAAEYGFDGRRYNDYTQDIERFRKERDANLQSASRFRPFVFVFLIIMGGLSILWRLVKPEQLSDFSKSEERITMSEPIQVFKIGAQVYEFAVGEKSFWTASENNRVQEWRDRVTEKPVQTISLSDAALAIALYGNQLVIGDKSGMVNLIHLTDSTNTKTFKGHSSAVTSIQFSSSGNEVLTASWDKTVRIWNAQTGDQLRTRMGIAFPIYSATFDQSGTSIGFTNDAQAMLWNWREGTMKQLTLHKRRVFATAAFGDWIATAGEDRIIKQIHFKTNSVRAIEGDAVALKIAYRHDGKLLAAAGQDGRVRIYDSESCKKLEVIDAHRGKTNAVAFSPDGLDLYTAGADSVVKMWDLRKFK